jgi:hypothetical protein
MERDEIIKRLSEIALHDFVVYAAMTQYQKGAVTLEQAMFVCIDVLVKQSEYYRTQLVDAMIRQTR